mgnify:CR=1 FL=1
MNIFISYRNFEENESIINTTGDYNICYGIKLLCEKYDHFIYISENNFYKHKLQDYNNIVKYYNSEINAIIIIEGLTKRLNYPNKVKQFKYIVDIHGHDINKYCNINLLLPYAYSYNRYNYTPNKEKIYFFPHSIKYNVEFNKNPIHKVLLSGRGRKNIFRYPMRAFMYNQHLQNNNIDYLKPDHSYRTTPDKLEYITSGQKYINKLNKYLCCFTDDLSIYSPYLICKFFEILSSGSLLLASVKNTKIYFKNLGFIDGIHYISMNTENFKEKINYILNNQNREEIDKIRYNGYILANQYHTSEHRAKQLIEIINNTSNVVCYKDGIDLGQYYLVKNNIS